MLSRNQFTAEEEDDIMAELQEIISQATIEAAPTVPHEEFQPSTLLPNRYCEEYSKENSHPFVSLRTTGERT